MANFISPEKQTAVIAALSEGCGIREISRLTGVNKNTVRRYNDMTSRFAEAMWDGPHLVLHNASTAFGRRRRAWVEAGLSIPDGFVVGCKCDNSCCILLEHAEVRPKIDTATRRPIFLHCVQQILRLGVGETLGVAVPEEWDDEAYRIKLSSMLRQAPFHYFRWGARLRADRVVIVHKLGTWASKKKSYESKPYTLPPAHQPLDEAPPTDWAFCLGCGERFTLKPRRQEFCSRTCKRRYKQIAAELARL